MNWRRGLIFGIEIVGMCFLATTALAQDSSEFILLKGLKGVSVFVQPLDSSVKLENLNQSKIKMDIEQKLQSAGIKVLTQRMGSGTRSPNSEYLFDDTQVSAGKYSRFHLSSSCGTRSTGYVCERQGYCANR